MDGNFSEIGKRADFIEQLSQNGLPMVAKSTKLVQLLPCGASRDAFYAYPSFGKIVDIQSNEILKIISKILKLQCIKGNIERRQQDEQFEMILDCNDVMLERINSSLDNISGIRRNPETLIVESELGSVSPKIKSGIWNSNSTQKITTNKLITALNIPRPQASFNSPVDNGIDAPFKPKIKLKPNALAPLAILPEYDANGDIESFSHPYEFELLRFEPPSNQLEMAMPQNPKDMVDTEYFYIDKKEELIEAIYNLKKEKEIAIDLEHHSYRSYQGITCLMQLSTNTMDYIIDTISLRDDLQILNEIFTDTNVLKIFHGADLDIEWLQRDLGLYVVNMFDTHQAAKMIGLSGLSLKFLLKHYCNIAADKQFQLADWRIRPLPAELVYYARQDTHYLIYVAHILQNELLNQPNGLLTLKAVYNSSREICRRRYVKPKVTDDSYVDMYKRSKRTLDNRQLYALREIYIWRDNIARLEDESCGYVLPNHMLLQIAENLPREMQGILACCNPIPSLVRQNLNTLHKIILKAREQPLVKKLINIENTERTLLSTKDFTSKINCLYDSCFEIEFRENFTASPSSRQCDFNFKSILNIFEECKTKQQEKNNSKIRKSRNIKFASPYQRYKAVVSINEKEKQDENSKIQQKRNIPLCPIKKEIAEDVILDVETKETGSASVIQNLKRKVTGNLCLKECEKVKKVFENKKKRFDPQSHTTSKTKTNKTTMQFPISVKNEMETKNKNEKIKDESKNFDYSKIDFRSFQGGSYKQQLIDRRGGNLKRNNKTNLKKYNKIFTFSSGNKRK